MYRIGIEQEKWRVITDGNEVYEAEKDVRYYSKPPEIGASRFGQYTNSPTEENRVKRLLVSPVDFDRYCQSKGWEVRSCATSGKKVKKMTKPAAIGGILGAVIGGPVGAAVGAGISGWLASGSDFNIENISSAFLRAKEHAGEWVRYDKAFASCQEEEERRYIQKAEEEWNKYHNLKNISSLDDLDGFEFESAIAGLYEHKGYSVEITKASGDYGVDVLARKGTEVLAIQAKRYTRKVGIKAVQEVSSGAFYYKATKAIVITNSFFTDQAKELAKNTGIILVNKKRLANMWESYQLGNSLPPFNLREYERIKKQIKSVLYRTDTAAGKKFSRRYTR